MSKVQIANLCHHLPLQLYSRDHKIADKTKAKTRGTLWCLDQNGVSIASEHESCILCHKEFAHGDDLVVQLPCHATHIMCAAHVVSWILDAPRGSPKCPSCSFHMFDWVDAVDRGYVGEGSVAEFLRANALAERERLNKERAEREERIRQFVMDTERARQEHLLPAQVRFGDSGLCDSTMEDSWGD